MIAQASQNAWSTYATATPSSCGVSIGWRRNMRSIVNTLHELTERGVTVRSLHDGVDTSTSTGRMVAGILMSIAEIRAEN